MYVIWCSLHGQSVFLFCFLAINLHSNKRNVLLGYFLRVMFSFTMDWYILSDRDHCLWLFFIYFFCFIGNQVTLLDKMILTFFVRFKPVFPQEFDAITAFWDMLWATLRNATSYLADQNRPGELTPSVTTCLLLPFPNCLIWITWPHLSQR